jgi:hypothetical protein
MSTFCHNIYKCEKEVVVYSKTNIRHVFQLENSGSDSEERYIMREDIDNIVGQSFVKAEQCMQKRVDLLNYTFDIIGENRDILKQNEFVYYETVFGRMFGYQAFGGCDLPFFDISKMMVLEKYCLCYEPQFIPPVIENDLYVPGALYFNLKSYHDWFSFIAVYEDGVYRAVLSENLQKSSFNAFFLHDILNRVELLILSVENVSS